MIGLISDTHGLLREEAVVRLEGSELIIHAGDVGKPEILEALRRIAPVVAVRGNIDHDESLPLTAAVEAGGRRILVLHNLAELALDPAAAGFHAVVSGHSHRPARIECNGVLYINPGAAGPRRFRLPVTVALLDAKAQPPTVEFCDVSGANRPVEVA